MLLSDISFQNQIKNGLEFIRSPGLQKCCSTSEAFRSYETGFMYEQLSFCLFDGDGGDDGDSDDAGAAERSLLAFENVPAALLTVSSTFFSRPTNFREPILRT